VVVLKDQLSLAIGKGGQNVRLASKLTGWEIDVFGEGEQQNAAEAQPAPSPEAPPGNEQAAKVPGAPPVQTGGEQPQSDVTRGPDTVRAEDKADTAVPAKDEPSLPPRQDAVEK
jgi:hypothetical protein